MNNTPNFDCLNKDGLNMQAVFNLSELPKDIMAGIEEQEERLSRYSQLILIGHGGRRMWEAANSSGFRDGSDPVDNFSIDCVERWLAEELPEACYRIIYPASQRRVPLQSLGKLAGWHHCSPFRIGINQIWGSWFAYRVALLTDTRFESTRRLAAPSPCESCSEKPCVAECPPDALACDDYSLKSCINYRLSCDSRCKTLCLARLACPVAREHRYCMEQINYHYGRSMQTIEAREKK